MLHYISQERLALWLNFAILFLDISVLLAKLGHPEKWPGSVAMGRYAFLKLPSMPLCPNHTFGLRCFLISLLMVLGKGFPSVMAYGPLVFHKIQMGVMTVYFFFYPTNVLHHTPL